MWSELILRVEVPQYNAGSYHLGSIESDLRVWWTQAAPEEQEELLTLAVRIASLAKAFDKVASDGEAMDAAAELFQDILQVILSCYPSPAYQPPFLQPLSSPQPS